MPREREVAVVIGVSMKDLQKRSGGEDQTARPQDPEHLRYGPFRILEMLEHGLAVDCPDA